MYLFSFSCIKRIVPALVFAAISGIVLLGFYQDLLYTIHLRTPFIEGSLFFDDLFNEPFGLMKWVGCWLSQLCYYPLLGAIALILIWTLSYFLGLKASGLSTRWSALFLLPLSCLLLGVVGIGYWVYIIKEYGLFFSQSVAFLLMLSVLCVVKDYVLPRNHSSFIVLLIAILLYPVVGWFSFLFVLCVLPALIRTNGLKALIILLAILSPTIYKYILFDGTSNEMLWRAGFPLFDDQAVFHIRQSVPYILLAITTLAIFVFSAFGEKHNERSESTSKRGIYVYAVVTLLVSAIAFLGVWQFMFKDYNYLAEMRMVKYSLDDNWQKVVEEAQQTSRPSRAMVVLKNIALMNTGELGDRSFQLSNDGREIKNPDSLNVNSMQIAAPIIYYNYGKIVFATRWATEFAVTYGYSPFVLMNLCRSALAKGETKAAERYLTLLHSHLFYVDWQPKPVSPLIKELDSAFADVLDSDGNNAENYLINIFSNSSESGWATVREIALFHSMLTGEPSLFWPCFIAFAQVEPDQVLPLHYQEAYCCFMERFPIEMPFKVKINDSTVQNYVSFRRQYQVLKDAGYDNETIGEALRGKWSGTYWWHTSFGRSRY